jgi:Protein of unknown function (DUF1441)
MVSMSQYAAMRGITQPAVSAAIHSGRLVKAIIKDGKRIKIDPDIADREWAANTQGGRGAAPQRLASGVDLPDAIEAADYNASRAKREAYNAELARLEVEEKQGQLVAADEVRKTAFAVARQVRDGMLNIPDRVSAELAAVTDQFEIHRRLTDEIRKALEGVLASADESDLP